MTIEEFLRDRSIEMKVEIPYIRDPRLQFHMLKLIQVLDVVLDEHKRWPVMVETPMKVEQIGALDSNDYVLKASQQLAFLTHEEFRRKFGSEPPTAPILKRLAMLWADHPDYREEW